MLIKCPEMVTPHFANNGSLISLNNDKVPSSVHYSSSKGTALLSSPEKFGVYKNKRGLVVFSF